LYITGIREEIRQIENGLADRDQNVLKLAPHTLKQICNDEWNRPYSRKVAAYPMVVTFFYSISILIYLSINTIYNYVF